MDQRFQWRWRVPRGRRPHPDPLLRAGYREMRRSRTTRRRIGWLGGLLTALVIAGQCYAQSVLGYRGSPDRAGNFIVPGLTWECAGSLQPS